MLEAKAKIFALRLVWPSGLNITGNIHSDWTFWYRVVLVNWPLNACVISNCNLLLSRSNLPTVDIRINCAGPQFGY